MSPPRQEHTSRYIESVIYEPLPRIVLSRSTYKITSFIEFAPYIESFKAFERFLNRFTRDLDNPDFVGPLYNINRTKPICGTVLNENILELTVNSMDTGVG